MEFIKNHKIIIVIAITVAAILAIAWFVDDSNQSQNIPMQDLAVDVDAIYDEMDLCDDVDETIEESDAATSSIEQTTETRTVTNVVHEPVEPESATLADGSFTVTLSVRVDTLVNNIQALHIDKRELVPNNGVIFFEQNVKVYEGESVFAVLQREMRANGIHMSSRFTPIFNSAYIEAINNIFEFDAGPLSGWVYRVNGWFPNYGASRYLLEPNDVIEWMFSLDLGRDVGGSLAGWQRD